MLIQIPVIAKYVIGNNNRFYENRSYQNNSYESSLYDTSLKEKKLKQPTFYLQAIQNKDNQSVISILQEDLRKEKNPLAFLADIADQESAPPVPAPQCQKSRKYDPKRHKLFTIEKAKELEMYKENYMKLCTLSRRKRIHASPKARALWSSLVALCPVSLQHVELITAIMIKCFFDETNFLGDHDDLNARIAHAFTPSQSFVRSVI